MRDEFRVLFLALALAAGEGLGVIGSRGAEVWPAVAVLALLVAFLGYGFAVRGWHYLALALVGLALSFAASVSREQAFRESPWLRGATPRAARQAQTPLAREFSRRIGWGLESDTETANLNRAILLGERARLPRQLKRMFVETGTIHVFAISGLHVMIVAKLFMVLVALFFVPLRWQGAVALPLLWGYVLLIGHPASAVRAALMASFYFGAPLVWRRPNALVAWSLTFLLVHLVAPDQISNVGSLFSFTVMLVILFAARLARGGMPRLGQVLFVSSAAWAAGVPIAALVFGRLSPGAILANLILIALASGSVVCGLLGVLMSYLSLPLARHFNNLAALATEGMVHTSQTVAALPLSQIEVAWWTVADSLGWYVALGLTFYLIAHIQARRKLIWYNTKP